MALVLSTRDQKLLRHAFSVLSSPLDAPSIAHWRADVLTALRPLFNADAGSFVLAHEGEPTVTLLERPPSYVEEYEKYQMRDVTLTHWQRQGSPRVCSTRTLCGGDRRVYTNSEIYSLFFQRFEIGEAIQFILDVAEQPPMLGPGRPFAPGGVPVMGLVCLYADRPGKKRFGDEGLELMGLLHPLLRAGAQTWKDLAENRGDMVRLLDHSRDALAVFDRAGRELHRNRRLAALLHADPNAGALQVRIARVAAELVDVLEGRARARSQVQAGAALECDVDTGFARYVLRATRVSSLLGPSGATVVIVEQRGARAPSEKTLRHRFGLTQREGQVATLLAAGDSNKAIVAKLCVTEFTARRHTENVLRKLRADSRAKVASILANVEA